MIDSVLFAVVVSASAQASLQPLIDREGGRQLGRNPVWASLLGEPRFDARWDDVRPEALRRGVQGDRGVLAQIGAIDASSLDAEGRLDHELLSPSTQ